MGAVNFSLDMQLVTGLKKVLPLPVFFETGTFKGDTIKEMLPYFDRLITAELSEPLWKEATNRFVSEKKVEPYLGNSPDVIAKFHSVLKDSSVLYWLDAHWCVADDTSGEKSQCPLLEEIHSIGQLNDQSVILIDDARLFLAPPPAPHETSQWPSIDSIITALKQTSLQHELSVVNDVIIFYPKLVRDSVISYAKKQGVDWLRANQSLLENVELRRVLEEKHKALMRLTGSLEEKEEALVRLTGSLEEKEEALMRLTGSLEEKEEALMRLTESLEEKEEILMGLTGSLEEKEEEALMRLTGSLEEKEEVLMGLTGSLEEKEEALMRLTGSLEEKEEALMRLTGSLKEKEEALMRLTESLEEKALVRLTGSLEEKEEALMRLTESLEEKEEVLMRLTESLKEKEEALVRLTGSLEEKEAVIQGLGSELEACHARLLNLDNRSVQ